MLMRSMYIWKIIMHGLLSVTSTYYLKISFDCFVHLRLIYRVTHLGEKAWKE